MYLWRNHFIDVLKMIEALFLGGKFQSRSSRKEEIFWVRACVVAPPSALPGPMDDGWGYHEATRLPPLFIGNLHELYKLLLGETYETWSYFKMQLGTKHKSAIESFAMQVRSHRLHRSCFSSTWLFVWDSPPLTMLHIGLHSHWSSDPGNATIRLDLACPTCKHHYEGQARHWSLPFLDYQILIAKHDHIQYTLSML